MKKWQLISLLICTVWVGVGCKQDEGMSLNRGYDAYHRGHFQESLNVGVSLYRSGGGFGDEMSRIESEEAVYLAGLSADRLGRHDVAKGYLRLAEGSADRLLAGDAKAQLGLIYMGDGDYALAKLKFDQAAGLLIGPSRKNAKAKSAAADIHLQLDKRGHLGGGKAGVKQRGVSLAGVAKNGYTLQLGAYRRKGSAQRTASTYASKARRLGYGQVWVVYDRMSKLYRVRVGHFKTLGSALGARRRVGAKVCTVMKN